MENDNCKECHSRLPRRPPSRKKAIFCGHKCAHIWNNRNDRYGSGYMWRRGLLKKGDPKTRLCSNCKSDIAQEKPGRLRCETCRKKYGNSRPLTRGKKHWRWMGGVNPIRIRIMGRAKYKIWRKSVFERDNYTCVWCGQRGKVLHADHIKLWSKFPRYRYVLSNGRTLCISCHRKRHSSAHK